MKKIIKTLIFAPFLLFLNGCSGSDYEMYSQHFSIFHPDRIINLTDENPAVFANKYNERSILVVGYVEDFNSDTSFTISSFPLQYLSAGKQFNIPPILPVCEIRRDKKDFIYKIKKGDPIVAMGRFNLDPNSMLVKLTLEKCIFAKAKRHQNGQYALGYRYSYDELLNQPWCDLSQDPIFEDYRKEWTMECDLQGYYKQY